MITVNGRQIEFHAGMTLANALKEAGEVLDEMTIVFMDNRVLHHDQLEDEILHGCEDIKLLKIVSGG